MIDHVSLGTQHYPEAVAFYRQTLEALGWTLLRDTGSEAAFGTAEHWCFFLYPVEQHASLAAPGTHIALSAPSRAAVAAVHQAALGGAAQDLFTPRSRTDISPTYFGAMFRDLDGHKIEVMTNAS